MKSPVSKIQSSSIEGMQKIEPLIFPERDSVPPLCSGTLMTDGTAVSPTVQPLAPVVRDATSVAASQVAWTGDPSPTTPMRDTPRAAQPQINEDIVFCRRSLVLLAADMLPPLPPSLEAPLEMDPTEYVAQVASFERDAHPCFEDSEYARYPVRGPLHTFYYTSVVVPPAHSSAQVPPQ